MTACFGTDTSILVRLPTGDSEDGFEHCVRKLTALIERDDAEVFALNQVIGEAYIALQRHYGVSKPDARAAPWITLHRSSTPNEPHFSV